MRGMSAAATVYVSDCFRSSRTMPSCLEGSEAAMRGPAERASLPRWLCLSVYHTFPVCARAKNPPGVCRRRRRPPGESAAPMRAAMAFAACSPRPVFIGRASGFLYRIPGRGSRCRRIKNLTPTIQLFHFASPKNQKKPLISCGFSGFPSLHSGAARLYFRWTEWMDTTVCRPIRRWKG